MSPLMVRQIPQRLKHLVAPRLVTPVHEIAVSVLSSRVLVPRLHGRQRALARLRRRRLLRVLSLLQRLDDALHEGQRDREISVLRDNAASPSRASPPGSSPAPPRSDPPPCCRETPVALRGRENASLPRLNSIGGML